MNFNRRLLFSLITVLLLRGTLSFGQSPINRAEIYPIVFVHGNGDDASKWIGPMWLFESNGYPKDLLFAIRFSNPSARTDDTKPEANRSSTIDATAELSAFVTRVLLETHRSKVVLVGSSRGGLTIRNYILRGGGRNNVASAILAGTPNHGVLVSTENPNGEFNGGGKYLQELNRADGGGSEVVAGIRFLTLRSDKLDKYAQPTAIAMGSPQTNTGVGFDGPALRGATNLVLPNLDHRELAFAPPAFREMFRFVVGRDPVTLSVQAEPTPEISGVITGFNGMVPTNLPLANVHVKVFAVSPGEAGDLASPVYEMTTGADGHWGPFKASSTQEYCFDLEFEGRHVRYYKAPLLRSTALLNLRFASVPRDPRPKVATDATSALLITRPDGYFAQERDPVLIDGKLATEEPKGLPVRDSFVAQIETTKPVTVTLRNETIIAQPSKDLAKDLRVIDFLW